MPEIALLNHDRTIREYRTVAQLPNNHQGTKWVTVTRQVPNAYQVAVAPTQPVAGGAQEIAWTVADAPLATMKTVKKAAALAVFNLKIAAGRAHSDGHTYQLGPDKTGALGTANITAMTLKAEASLRNPVSNPWPDGFTFRSAGNENVAKTAQQMFDLGSDVGEYVRALRKRLWAINDAADAAGDKAAIEAIDETAGWPGNG